MIIIIIVITLGDSQCRLPGTWIRNGSMHPRTNHGCQRQPVLTPPLTRSILPLTRVVGHARQPEWWGMHGNPSSPMSLPGTPDANPWLPRIPRPADTTRVFSKISQDTHVVVHHSQPRAPLGRPLCSRPRATVDREQYQVDHWAVDHKHRSTECSIRSTSGQSTTSVGRPRAISSRPQGSRPRVPADREQYQVDHERRSTESNIRSTTGQSTTSAAQPRTPSYS